MSAKKTRSAAGSSETAEAQARTDFASSVKRQLRCIFRQLADSAATSRGEGQRDQASFIVVDGVRYRRVGDSPPPDPTPEHPLPMAAVA